MADERDEIRSRINLVELVGQKVALKRTGKNWKGLCPFHDDRNPSFYVSPDIGYYRCWSCGESGDAFTWVMKTQNLTFYEALQALAKQAGVTLKPRSGDVSKTESDQRAAAMDASLRFFREQLQKSPSALAYCERRGLDDQVQKDWELGYAPDVGEALAVHLQRNKHPLPLCRALFLVDQDAGGGYYDRFRGRLMFPIRDERGQLVAFGGRLLGEGHPKYVNSGDTPIYRKSRVLYGLNHAKQKLLETRRAVLVEGYLDVIACHRAGVTEAVASLGTAFAEDHAKLMKRWCDKATILYDGDEAGQKAAERASEILKVAGIEPSVAVVSAGDDPDTLLKREGPDAVQKAATNTISPLAFTLQRLEARVEPSTAAFWDEATAAMAACDTPAEVDKHVTELAARHMKGQTEAGARITIYAWIKNHRRQQRKSAPLRIAQEGHKPFMSSMTPAEAVLFMAFLEEGYRAAAWTAIHEDGLIWTETAIALAAGLRASFPDRPPVGPPKDWIGQIESEGHRAKLADIQFYSGHKISGKPVEDVLYPESIESAIRTLRNQREQRRIGELKKEAAGEEKLINIMDRLRNLKAEVP